MSKRHSRALVFTTVVFLGGTESAEHGADFFCRLKKYLAVFAVVACLANRQIVFPRTRSVGGIAVSMNMADRRRAGRRMA